MFLNVHENKTNKYNRSFRVDINITDRNKIFESNAWYEGLIIKPFRFPRKRLPTILTDDTFSTEKLPTDIFTDDSSHIPQKLKKQSKWLE